MPGSEPSQLDFVFPPSNTVPVQTLEGAIGGVFATVDSIRNITGMKAALNKMDVPFKTLKKLSLENVASDLAKHFCSHNRPRVCFLDPSGDLSVSRLSLNFDCIFDEDMYSQYCAIPRDGLSFSIMVNGSEVVIRGGRIPNELSLFCLMT